MTITPVPDESGGVSHLVAIKSDVTERRRLEEQLREAQKIDANGRLAGGIAHDVNNALAVILGFAERALRPLEPLDALQHDLREIVRTVERSASLTRQLLAFARRQIVAPRGLGLNDAIASLANMLHRLIGEDVDLRIVAGEGLWNVKIDPSQVDQVLVNLATNARAAIPDVGTITVQTSNVTVNEESCRTRVGWAPGEYVLLSVSDTGAGMDAATRERVFEPFFTTKPEFWFARGFDTPLPSFDEKTAAAASGAHAVPWARHVEEFRAVRLASLAFFRNLPAEAWSRSGIASGNPFSVRGLAYVVAGHAAHHVGVIREKYS